MIVLNRCTSENSTLSTCKARQTIESATLVLDLHAGGRSLFIANTTYTRQIYNATAIKSGRVIAWKAIWQLRRQVSVEAGADAKQ